MPGMNRRNWLATSGTTLLAASVLPAAVFGETSDHSAKSPRERIRARHFPNVTLLTHEGKEVRFYDDLMKDKIVIINMMYVKCEGICMPITMNLLKVQKLLGHRMGRDIFMYSITLKPEQDNVRALRHYAHMHHVKPGWLFLTGKPNDIELLRRRLGFTDPDPDVDKDKTNHIGNIKYGNEARMLWAGCPGLSRATAIAESISWVDWPKDKVVPAGKGGQQ